MARAIPKLFLLPLILSAVGCGDRSTASDDAELAATIMSADIPAELAAGEAAFNADCATCHGQRALGTERGPPLVHIVYEPNHHADAAFHLAVARGVRAHHWSFGDMPPIPTVDPEEMSSIIAYVRYLQRQVGIL